MRSNFVLKNSWFEFRAPFYDNDLIDFAQIVPLSLRKNSRIMIKVFLTMFPELAKISFEAAGCPVHINRFQAITQKSKKLFRRIMSHLFKGSFREYRLVDYGRWFRENRQLREHVKEILLSQKAKERPYFNPEVVQKILEDQFNGKKDNWMLINKLIILELWHRIFVDEEKK